MGIFWCVMIGAFYSEHRLYSTHACMEGGSNTLVLAFFG